MNPIIIHVNVLSFASRYLLWSIKSIIDLMLAYIMKSTTPQTMSNIPRNIKNIVADVTIPPIIPSIPKIKARIPEIFSRERIVSASGGTLPKPIINHKNEKIPENKVSQQILR